MDLVGTLRRGKSLRHIGRLLDEKPVDVYKDTPGVAMRLSPEQAKVAQETVSPKTAPDGAIDDVWMQSVIQAAQFDLQIQALASPKWSFSGKGDTFHTPNLGVDHMAPRKQWEEDGSAERLDRAWDAVSAAFDPTRALEAS